MSVARAFVRGSASARVWTLEGWCAAQMPVWAGGQTDPGPWLLLHRNERGPGPRVVPRRGLHDVRGGP